MLSIDLISLKARQAWKNDPRSRASVAKLLSIYPISLGARWAQKNDPRSQASVLKLLFIYLTSLGVRQALKNDGRSQASSVKLLSIYLITIGARKTRKNDPRSQVSFANFLLIVRDEVDDVHPQFKICQHLYFLFYTSINVDLTTFVFKVIYDNAKFASTFDTTVFVYSLNMMIPDFTKMQMNFQVLCVVFYVRYLIYYNDKFINVYIICFLIYIYWY